MRMGQLKRVMTESEIGEVYEMLASNCTLKDVAKRFEMSVYDFYEYRKKYPMFSELLKAARTDTCWDLECRAVGIPEEFADSPKMASVCLQMIQWVTSVRNPGVYNPRQQIDVTHTVVDIRGAIEAGKSRMDNTIDVTPQPAISAHNADNELHTEPEITKPKKIKDLV